MTALDASHTDYRRKIVELPRLLAALDARRRGPGGRVVQCHGCFDIVHPGHIRYLQFAKDQGDVLVVSITGDAGIDKGAQRPYIPEELRAENLAALEFVDYVVIDPHPTAAHVLSRIRPDVYVKGQEYALSADPRFVAEREVVESAGGRVIFSSGHVVFSSSRLGENLEGASELEAQRLGVICARHGISSSSIRRLLREFQGKRVALIGECVVERYVLCDAGGVAGESPMMSLTELDRQDYCGGAAFMALCAAALGAKPTLITRLGCDTASQWLARALEAAGVELREVERVAELPVRTRFLVDDQKVLKTERAESSPLDSVGQKQAVRHLAQAARGADGALVFDCGFGLLTPGLHKVLRGSFRRSVPAIGGAAGEPRGDLRMMRGLDLLLTSERRLRSMMNDYGAGLSALAYQLLQASQSTRLIVSVGKRGLVTFDRPSHDARSKAWNERLLSEYFPSLATRVTDRLGCGESAATIATLVVTCGGSLMQAAYLAGALAAIQIARQGLQHVTTNELGAWLATRPELFPSGREEPADALCLERVH